MVETFLGTHRPNWLGLSEFAGVPLFVSYVTLSPRKTLPRAVTDWAEDSGGFSELSSHGKWTVSARDYVAAVRRHRDEIGRLRWAAIQDWMCEPFITAKTGLSVDEHQRRTVDSYAQLLDLAPELPWTPVLQGWKAPDDYLRCWELYEARGFDLSKLPVVGIGSVCRRQHTGEAARTICDLARQGLHIHGFGFKVQGLRSLWNALESSDSLAWSFRARRSPPLSGCKHKSCANCSRFALHWYRSVRRMLSALESQMNLFSEAA